jgi:2-dehydro-3-deoxy-D-arabinonate dehydratase
MRLVQFAVPGRGNRVGLVEGDRVLDITVGREGIGGVADLVATGGTAAGVERLVRRLRGAGRRAAYSLSALQRLPGSRVAHLRIPIDPPEVWGAGITYRRSADFYSHAIGREKGIYDHVYNSERPELFFKASASRCVGPNGPLRVRSDSRLTAPEPELAFILGVRGTIVGYTLCNDLSAWDIERENPLFLPQSKVFAGCCALGPVIVTAGELRDPYQLELTCRLWRGDKVIFEGAVKTSQLKRRCDELSRWLLRDNVIPPGTVVSTGTGILVPDEFALRNGDRVEITVPEIGTLANPVRQGRRPS